MSTTLKVLLGAGAVIATAGIVYYLTRGGEEEVDVLSNELKADLEKLGEIRKEASGVLKLHDFIELFKLVTKHAKKKISQIKQEYAKERRQALSEGRESEYRRIVSE